jgi:hypothetical protein
MTHIYLRTTDGPIPPGNVVTHNFTWNGQQLGEKGFRAWWAPLDDGSGREPCSCGWAPHLGPHYRTLMQT